MKNSFLLFLAAAFVGLSFPLNVLHAQSGYTPDTITSFYVPSNYYCHRWFDTSRDVYRETHIMFSDMATEYHLKQFKHTDSIKIYGIAVSLDRGHIGKYCSIADTCIGDSVEQVMLFQQTGTSQYSRVSDSLAVVMDDSQVRHYFHLMYESIDSSISSYHPVREVYFDKPVTLSGDFFIGITGRTWIFDAHRLEEGDDFPPGATGKAVYRKVPVGMLQYVNWDGKLDYDRVLGASKSPTGELYWGKMRHLYGFEFLFPILTPPDYDPASPQEPQEPRDTLRVDTLSHDTVSIVSPGAMQRYVSVNPNPAGGEVKVLSSLGIEIVEAFNAVGERVEELRVGGSPQVVLNVASWPAGHYTLRVHTPLGIVAKRLLVHH